MLIQSAVWPGVAAVESCQGTVSHGISPATFLLTTIPEYATPLPFGDLLITSGATPVRLRGCKLHQMTARAGSNGQTFILEIFDRRWRWRGFGAVSGRFNRVDTNAKAVAWTLRSPKELAAICLREMDEPNYLIDLPEGLSQKDGKDLDRYLRLGENFKQTLANPPVVWDRSPPAEVLARMVEYYGRRIIYQPNLDRVLIAPLGVGATLPDGGCEVIAPGVQIPDSPRGIGVAGTVKIQCRLALEAVGRDWDGSYLPIDQLSYAPRYQPSVQITTLTFLGGVPSGLTVSISWTPPGRPPVTVDVFASGATIADVFAMLKASIAANPEINQYIAGSFIDSEFTFKGLKPAQFNVTYTQVTGANAYKVKVVQLGRVGGGSWAFCGPTEFAAVQPTDRLSKLEAQGLAQASVFRCFRIMNVDPSTGKAPLKLPWYGKIKRRQQIVLLGSKVAQVVPQAATHPRLQVESLPACAPELNPVEHLWSQLKWGRLANFAPDDADELRSRIGPELRSMSKQRNLLGACWRGAKLRLPRWRS